VLLFELFAAQLGTRLAHGGPGTTRGLLYLVGRPESLCHSLLEFPLAIRGNMAQVLLKYFVQWAMAGTPEGLSWRQSLSFAVDLARTAPKMTLRMVKILYDGRAGFADRIDEVARRNWL